MLDYLAIGQLTHDRLPTGGVVPGGTVRYAALVAARLGLRAGMLTACEPALLASLPPEIAVAVTPSPTTTTFENRYGPTGRRQWLYERAAPIDLQFLPAEWHQTPVVHLAPVADEVALEAALDTFPNALIGVTPQGWMRHWSEPLPAEVRPAPWQPDPALLHRIALLVMSIEDIGGDEALAEGYAAHCPLVVVTRGAAGATLYCSGVAQPVAAYATNECDPTGAGDVFATTMLLRLHETGDPVAAAAYAAAAAACSVAGPGLGNLWGRGAVEALMGSVGS